MTPGNERRSLLADGAILVGVAATLVALHVSLSADHQAALTFEHADVQPYTIVTAAYVHLGIVHLLGNVGGFLATGGMAVLLCLVLERRGWFRATLPWLLVGVPAVANAASYVATLLWHPDVPVASRGFSAVVAGTGGFVFVALVAVLARDRGRDVGLFGGGFVLLGLLAMAYVRLVDTPAWLVLATLGTGLAVTAAGSTVALRNAAQPENLTRLRGRAIPILLVVALLGTLAYGLFPAEQVQGGYRTDVVAHGAGFLAGVLGAAATRR